MGYSTEYIETRIMEIGYSTSFSHFIDDILVIIAKEIGFNIDEDQEGDRFFLFECNFNTIIYDLIDNGFFHNKPIKVMVKDEPNEEIVWMTSKGRKFMENLRSINFSNLVD